MRFPKFSKTEWVVLAGMTLVLAALILSPGVSVWDGHFPLTISIDGTEPIGRDSLLLATFWSESEAEEAVTQPGLYAYRFRTPDFTAEGNALIEVAASGRMGNWMTNGTYNHQQHLVVAYRPSVAGNDPATYKRFTIPAGRGARTLRIMLP
jgi:hypothetical protein